MRKSKFTEEQIAYALRQVEAGTPVKEVIRKLGVCEQTFYRWKRKFEGMGVAELRRLRVLEEENGKLERLVADLTLDKAILQEVIENSSDAGGQACSGRVRGGRLPAFSASLLCADRSSPVNDSLPEPFATARGAAPAHR